MVGFLLFAGDSYYPRGGMRDFQGNFATLDAAKVHFQVTNDTTKWGKWEWMQIADAQTLKVVYSEGYAYGYGDDGW